MFRATIDTNILQSSIKAMSALIDEAIMVIDTNGATSRAVDAANAAMATMSIPSTQFSTLDATETQLGLDLVKLSSILGMASKSSYTTLSIDEDTHKLNVLFDGFSYTLSLLDPMNMRKPPSVPELDLPAEITIDGAVFKQMVKAASMAGDNMRMGVHDKSFFMETTGIDDNVRMDLSESELIGLKSADVSSLFSLGYLTDVSKAILSASEVVIKLGRDLPVIIEFEPSADCPVVYILAPRITDD